MTCLISMLSIASPAESRPVPVQKLEKMHFPGVSRGRWRHRVHLQENFHSKMQHFHTAELTVIIQKRP